MATMQDIEIETRQFAKAKRALDEIMGEITSETEALKKKYLPRIRSVMNTVTMDHAELYRMIGENPDLFTKPRTQIIDGVRVGFSKGTGTLAIEDPETTIKLIRKHFEDQADILIRTTYEPAKAAIKKLDEAQLKKIGCAIEGKEDRVIIEETDTQINKILGSLLKFQVEELTEELRQEAA
jgi:hypothetical protein